MMSSSSSQERKREFPFTRRDFDYLRKIASDRTGIAVSEDKFNMFYSRLSRRIRNLGLHSFKEYCDYLENDESDGETLELINAITTNLTAFFRENHHFTFLSKTVIPELLRRNRETSKVRIWSAGCSTGEEPYSISISLHESLPLKQGWDARILATDVDSEALARASQGVYPEERITGISGSRLHRWFLKGKGKQQGMVRVKTEVSGLVEFKRVNLLGDWALPEPMDVIFCRNVIIYFDKPEKIKLIENLANALKQGGYLFMGHSESLFRLTKRFQLVETTVYKKKG
jgi:chemotaxis protein methyltransferase CheR